MKSAFKHPFEGNTPRLIGATEWTPPSHQPFAQDLVVLVLMVKNKKERRFLKHPGDALSSS